MSSLQQSQLPTLADIVQGVRNDATLPAPYRHDTVSAFNIAGRVLGLDLAATPQIRSCASAGSLKPATGRRALAPGAGTTSAIWSDGSSERQSSRWRPVGAPAH